MTNRSLSNVCFGVQVAMTNLCLATIPMIGGAIAKKWNYGVAMLSFGFILSLAIILSIILCLNQQWRVILFESDHARAVRLDNVKVSPQIEEDDTKVSGQISDCDDSHSNHSRKELQ
ncbi:hypothetical protein ADUPG1_012323 [Aduncisulcus paluster]|uniref:Uncharacterized protein n=1 Tax=Aduncisulcus paluster TaxID=2918883 RepID=A0ABQ5JZ27_9EUKA|nr:hypothetical protein ADUPG1_012323 [Aduncisulcus paluster]